MRNVLVIPARMGSTRFPGKPLTQVAGHTLIRRVHALASAVEAIDRVLVATDDPRIADHVASFGGEAVMTGESCRNGTERVLEAVAELDPKPEVVINLQGDAVLTPPWILEDLVAAFADPAIDVATPAVRLSKTAFAELRAAKAKGGRRRHVRGDGLFAARALLLQESDSPFSLDGRTRRDTAVFSAHRDLRLPVGSAEALGRIPTDAA